MKIKRSGPAPAQPTPPPAAQRPAPAQQAAPRRKSGALYWVALAFFALLFIVSAALLGRRLWEDHEVRSDFADLEALIEPAAPAADDGTQSDNAARFAALVARNPDFIGWISIDATNLSFPVMYSPDEPDFYLRHDFEGEYSDSGVPYLDARCTLTAADRSDNLVIYGHNMKTGTIFGFLTDYKQPETYQEHPTIRLDTLYGAGEYEVFAAFAIDIAADRSFAYNNYIDLDEDSFREFVEEVKRRSDVDSGITPVYGDELLTLSTCEYSSANGRYVVCARRTGG